MVETTHAGTPNLPAEYIKALASQLGWNIDIYNLASLAFVFPALLLLYQFCRNMQHGNTKPFRFTNLPPELREMVYEHLVEDPYYPPPPPGEKKLGSPLNWMLAGRWPSSTAEVLKPRGQRKLANWIFLTNKQIYAEYMDVLCKKTTFHLTVSPQNYTAPASTAPASATTHKHKIWKIAPNVLKNLRKCDIKMITTSRMLGVSDPRTMKPNDWALARQMREELKEVEKVHELNLHVKAIGDPLWNPLWVWYHASQSLKTMGSAAGIEALPGPKLNRIIFSLDTWSPGENHLERDANNAHQWAWWCSKGHCVGADGGAEVTVREFCARLYKECRTCRPELDSDGDEED